MRCNKCGKDNPGYTAFCGWCGNDMKEISEGVAEMPSESPTSDNAMASETPSQQFTRPAMRYCSKCGGKIRADSITCEHCGERPWQSPAPQATESIWEADEYTYHSSSRSDSSSPVIGGIMSILAGVFAVGQGLLYMAGSSMVSLYGGSLCLCGSIDFLFGIGAIYGGVEALKRGSFTIALVGAILGLLGFGFVIGALFGLLAVVFIAVSRDEFA
jgi:hypothetical protein